MFGLNVKGVDAFELNSHDLYDFYTDPATLKHLL